ncbi:MAG: transporter substrate-binding domain-containing protein [Hormoscilla sp.]
MERLRGTPGPDELFAGTRDTLIGGAGDDTLDATDGGGLNRLFGQDGDDLLKAGSRDLLVGGPGNDQLFVGSGRARLVGGPGADGFWIVDGELPERVNVVRDFQQGTDVLGIRGLTPEEITGLRVSQINPRDTGVQVAGENVAILRGVRASSLTMNDFFVAEEPEPPEPEDSLLDVIKDRGFLRVAVTDDAVGFSFQEEDGSFSGLGVDFSRAIATALFDDPDAIEYVVVDFSDGFDAVADGDVDLGATTPTHNVTRDATLGVDYSPIIFYDGQGVLVPADADISSFEDLEDLTIGVAEGTTSQQNLEDAAQLAGIEVNIEVLPDQDALFAAYDAGDIDGVSIDRGILVSSIPSLSDPDNQLILDEVISKEPLGLLVPENESEWADVVQWAVYATIQAEEFGIDSDNLEEFLETEDISIGEFLGLQGNLGEFLGLDNDFVAKIISEVGNYEEIYERNFDTDVLPRGLNQIWTEGGLLYSPPFSGSVPSDVELVNNDDRNVLAEVKERGFVRVGTSDDRPGSGLDVNGELQGLDVDAGRALAAAIFGDPNAVEFVIANTSAKRFSDVANGIVDVTINGTTHNLGRDASLGVDFAPIYIHDSQIVLVRGDSGVTSLADLAGQRVALQTGTTWIDNFSDRFEKLGLTFELVEVSTTGELLEAFRKGDAVAVSADGTLLGAANQADPFPEFSIVQEPLSKEPLAIVVDENQSEWADVVRWAVHTLIWAEELGVSSENVEELAQNSTDPRIQRLLGVTGNIGASLGLPEDFAVNMIETTGSITEIAATHFGPDLFGINIPWTQGGLFYGLPLA